jgi:hypothetical protein
VNRNSLGLVTQTAFVDGDVGSAIATNLGQYLLYPAVIRVFRFVLSTELHPQWKRAPHKGANL